MKALGEAAVHLPWLSPCAASLLALTRAPTAAVWSEVRQDPGCVLLLVRHAPSAAVSGLSLFPALLRDGAVLEAARSYLEAKTEPRPTASGFVDWNQPSLRPVYLTSLAYAHLAHRLAEATDRCPADNAWVGGLLAPLGWLAGCAAMPPEGRSHKPAGRAGPLPADFDTAAVGRRLAHRWKLPLWLATVVSHLGLPVSVAQPLGADPELFRVVQLAVALVEKQEFGLGLSHGQPLGELLQALGLNTAEAESWCAEVIARVKQGPALAWAPPESVILLPDLLRLAAENRRLGDLPALERLQSDVDVLHDALEEQHRGEAERLQAQKLAALAEFAAGAGHEINNPLAVISGQAQYLLRKLQMEPADPAAISNLQSAICNSLGTIIGQTQRIHHILTDLMQFARPATPQWQLVDVAGLIRDVVTTLQGLAGDRKVRLVCPEPPGPLTLYADAGQVGRALTCLLRNAIEAAPADGWAGVRVATVAPDRLELIVEDSGRGPLSGDCEHMFDPFYSGRKAGRGRGLGLPTAWRLARQHGGDVRFAGAEEGLTRFVLSLPLSAPEAPAERNGHVDCPVPSAA